MIGINFVTCQRRITNGSNVDSSIDSNFMVYLLNANLSETHGDWMCSGAIIHPYLVLTSAACLLDVPLIYVIAGYNKYVPSSLIETDECTKRFKKKVISYCTPCHYVLDKKLKWASYDIGIAKTDSQFDYYNLDYEKYCSYIPNEIKLQYNEVFEAPGTNVVTFGWGHSNFYSPPDADKDLNSEILQYASTIIMNKSDCKAEHLDTNKKKFIDSVMICTSGANGRIDANGVYQDFELPSHKSCGRRSGASDSNGTDENCRHERIAADPQVNLTETYNLTRRHGPCENDHGSPLVGWVGGQRFVLGVATTANVLPSMECTGPYLWTSVTATSKFVHCVLDSQKTSSVGPVKRRMCGEEMIIEKKLTWPASDEILD